MSEMADKFVLNDGQAGGNGWNSILELWRHRRNCDVEFICENNERILAHSIVLVGSGFDFLDGSGNQKRIRIKLPLRIMTKIVEYCYYGRLEIGATELYDCMMAFSLLNAKRLFDAVEDFFAKNIEIVPQHEFNKMSMACLRSLSSKCPEKKDFWLNVFFCWAEADEVNRREDHYVLIKQLLKQEAFNTGFEQIRDSSLTLLNRPYSKYLQKQRSYRCGNPFYFYMKGRIYSFDGSRIHAAEGFPVASDQTRDIIMISPERKVYFEILKCKAARLVVVRNCVTEYIPQYTVDGYCLNPPLLFLTDGRVFRVNQNTKDENEAIVERIPELENVIPKINSDTPQCLDFVDSEIILLKNRGFISYYTKMCLLSEDDVRQWKDVGLKKMTYLDVDGRGQLFGIQDAGCDHFTSSMLIVNGQLYVGPVCARMSDYTCPLPFISSWGAVITYNNHNDRVFRIGIDSNSWICISERCG